MAETRTYTHPTEGWTLRGDAAASYLEMRHQGQPVGGIDVFARSMKQQEYLYNGWKARKPGFNRAAKPSVNAPHVADPYEGSGGRATDYRTLNPTTKKYAPSPSFQWIMLGGDGSRSPKLGERIRGHNFGWWRTVSDERWHFEYIPSTDNYRQARLNWYLKTLGFFSLAKFQKSVGLADDGQDGAFTWAALLRAMDRHNRKPLKLEPVPPTQNGLLNMNEQQVRAIIADELKKFFASSFTVDLPGREPYPSSRDRALMHADQSGMVSVDGQAVALDNAVAETVSNTRTLLNKQGL